MNKKYQLGDLQYAIMQVLWETGQAAVSDVHRALLAERGLAPTTIATMLVKMEKKGIVRHRTEGRKFIYEPKITSSQVAESMIGHVAARLFGGDVTALVSHLLSTQDIDAEELQRLKRDIARREQLEQQELDHQSHQNLQETK
jgi:predicted transcriptional regulator